MGHPRRNRAADAKLRTIWRKAPHVRGVCFGGSERGWGPVGRGRCAIGPSPATDRYLTIKLTGHLPIATGFVLFGRNLPIWTRLSMRSSTAEVQH